MEFCSASFLVGLSIIPEGKPEGDEEYKDDDNGGDSTSERCPVELEPSGPCRLVAISELVAI